ncbi:MAG: thiol:disulfide interchange protein DsbA/DsbL [Succinivibrio sp.]
MLRKLIAAAALVLAASMPAMADDANAEYKEGEDYKVLETPKSETPEIREFFSFYCGHCFQMQGPFEQVAKAFEGKAKFEMNPVNALGGDMGVASEQAYAVAVVEGVGAEFVKELFDAIHVKQENPVMADYFLQKLQEVGIPHDKAVSEINSFVVKGMTAKWDKMVADAKIEAVPEIVVNGKYQVNMEKLNTVEDLIKVVGYLVTL